MRICITGIGILAEAVPLIEAYFPIFARASSECAVALRLRVDWPSRCRSSTSATRLLASAVGFSPILVSSTVGTTFIFVKYRSKLMVKLSTPFTLCCKLHVRYSNYVMGGKSHVI